MKHTVFALLVSAATTAAIFAADGLNLGAGRQPQVAITPQGEAYVVYGLDKKIHCALSTDGGATFGTPVLVATAPGLPLGMRRGPRIAITATHAVIAAISGPQGGGRDGDVLIWFRGQRQDVDGGCKTAQYRQRFGPRRSACAGGRSEQPPLLRLA